jgi:hypothetical protein
MTGSSTSTAISTKEDKKISLKRAEGLVLILDTPKGKFPIRQPCVRAFRSFFYICVLVTIELI